MFERMSDGRVKSSTGKIYKSFDEAEYAEPKCKTCDTRTIRNSFDQPEGFQRHYTKLWQEQYNAGVWLCPQCKKAQLMREGKELKRREKAGEDVSIYMKDVPTEKKLSIGG